MADKITWHPIATAEKLGKRGDTILLWLKPGEGKGYMVIGNYYDSLLFGPCWQYDEHTADLDVATHWAELPEGPDA